MYEAVVEAKRGVARVWSWGSRLLLDQFEGQLLCSEHQYHGDPCVNGGAGNNL
jgi:hypothetical protein